MVHVGGETRVVHLLAILRTVVEEEISPQLPRTVNNRICTYAKDYLRAFIKLIALRAEMTLPSPFYFIIGTVNGHLECM